MEARSPLSPAHCRDGRRAGGGRSRACGHTVCRPQEEGSLSTPDRLFKIVFVGNSAVGKTSFLRRFCDDRFSPGMTATVGKFSPLNWIPPPLGRGGCEKVAEGGTWSSMGAAVGPQGGEARSACSTVRLRDRRSPFLQRAAAKLTPSGTRPPKASQVQLE